MQFSMAAPGALTPSGGDYIGEWSVSASNVGLTDMQVEAWVSSALGDAGGWEQVSGLSFSQVSSGDGVIFRSVTDLPGNAIGTCYYDTVPPRVELKASFLGNKDLVNHEAAHAFFYATHSPEGSDSMLEPMEDPGDEGASATDVAQVEAWLDGAVPVGLPAATYFHPLDLPHYITKRNLSEQTEVSVSVAVPVAREAGLELGNTIEAVWAPTHADMVAGDYETLGGAVSFGAPGLYAENWTDIPGDAKDPAGVYVALTITTHLPIDELSLGQVELRAR